KPGAELHLFIPASTTVTPTVKLVAYNAGAPLVRIDPAPKVAPGPRAQFLEFLGSGSVWSVKLAPDDPPQEAVLFEIETEVSLPPQPPGAGPAPANATAKVKAQLKLAPHFKIGGATTVGPNGDLDLTLSG